MIPWYVGVAILIGVVIFLYFIKLPEKKIQESKAVLPLNTIKKEDIVLAELTEGVPSSPDYAILWNGTPGATYNYSINQEGGNSVASGTCTSKTNVFKIKGLPLIFGTTYLVNVDNTIVNIRFEPPSFKMETLILEKDKLECDTSSTPTDMEVLIEKNGKPVAVPISRLKFKIEPPGFIMDAPSGETIDGNVVVMIYNGRNVVNILTISLTDGESPESGQITPIPF